MKLSLKPTALAFAMAAAFTSPAWAGGDRSHADASVDVAPATSSYREATVSDDRNVDRSIGDDVAVPSGARAGMTTHDRTGMTGADAGSTSLRGDLAAGSADLNDRSYTDAVPLMSRGEPVDRFGSAPSGVHPNVPFDSEVTTMGKPPL